MNSRNLTSGLFASACIIAAASLQGCGSTAGIVYNGYSLNTYTKANSASYGENRRGSLVKAETWGYLNTVELYMDNDKQLWLYYRFTYPEIIRIGPDPSLKKHSNEDAEKFKRTLSRITLKKCLSNKLCADIKSAGYTNFIAEANGTNISARYFDYSIAKREFYGIYQYFDGNVAWDDVSINTDYRDAIFDADIAANRIRNISSKENLQKSRAFASFAGVETYPLLISSYNKRYKELDYEDAFHRADSVGSYLNFIENYNDYDPKGLVSEARQKVADIYRKQNSALGYWQAFDLLGEKSDFLNLQRAAKNSTDLTLLANAVFKISNNPGQFFTVNFSFNGTQLKTREKTNAGIFSMYEFFGSQSIGGKGTIAPSKNSPLLHSRAGYRVKLVASLKIPRVRQVRSNVLGDSDKSPETSASKEITLDMLPPYKQSFEVDFGDVSLIYFDRGSRGGFTADWIIGDPKITFKITSVQTIEN